MSAAILAALLTVNLAASAAIVLVILARKPARAALGARAAYWLWVVPLLAGLAGLLPARTVTLFLPPAPAPAPVSFDTLIGGPLSPAPLAATPAPVASLPPIDIPQLLVIAWAVVAATLLAIILLRQQRIVRRLGDSEVGPAVVGVLRPRLIVPIDFETRFSPRERDLVLAHERAHIAAGDTRINAGLALLTCLNWFNPLVHLAAKLARADQELACDAAVVERFPGERRIYAEALLKTQIAPASLPLGCTWPPRSSNLLKERVMMLASKPPNRLRRFAGVGLIAAAAFGAGLTAWAARPPKTVYVETPAPQLGQQKLERQIEPEYGPNAKVPQPQTSKPSAAELRIVAVKRARLVIRSSEGDTYADRTFEPGESYLPRIGAGWVASTDDGTAFEWRRGDKSLGLMSKQAGPALQSVDVVELQPIRLQRKPHEESPPLAPQKAAGPAVADPAVANNGTNDPAKRDAIILDLRRMLAAEEARLAELRTKYGELHPDVVQEKTRVESLRMQLAAMATAPVAKTDDAQMRNDLYLRLREQLNSQQPVNGVSSIPDGQVVETSGSVTVGDKETFKLEPSAVLPGDVGMKSVKLASGLPFALASRYAVQADGSILIRSAMLVDGKVLANPSLTVKPGQEARLTIGGVVDLRITPVLRAMTPAERNQAAAIKALKPAPPQLDPVKLDTPTFQVIQPPTFVPQNPTFAVAPDPNAPWPFANDKLVCDGWAISNGDPLVPANKLQQEMPIIFTFAKNRVKSVDISAMAAAFQAREFPKGLAEGGADSFRMAKDTASYRIFSKKLVDSFTFGNLDREKPSATWTRIRIDDAGPHEVFMEGRCHR